MAYAAVSQHGKTENVFPEIRGVMNETDWTWQQDGATPHTAKKLNSGCANTVQTAL